MKSASKCNSNQRKTVAKWIDDANKLHKSNLIDHIDLIEFSHF